MSAEALREEIRKSSEDRALQVLTEAKKKADAIIDEAELEARNILEKRVKEAEGKNEQTEKFEIANINMECTKKLLRLRSSYIDHAFHEAEISADRLPWEDLVLYRNVISNFIREALEGIGDVDLVVVARDSDKVLVQSVLDDLRNGSGFSWLKCKVSQTESLQSSSGGIIIHSANMRIYYVNTFESRFAKVKEEFRAEVVEVLERKE